MNGVKTFLCQLKKIVLYLEVKSWTRIKWGGKEERSSVWVLNSLVSPYKAKSTTPTHKTQLSKQPKKYKSTSSGPEPQLYPTIGLFHQKSVMAPPAFEPLWPTGPDSARNERGGPSTNRDFGLCVLVWDLVLDLICVPWVAAGPGTERRRVPAAFNHSPTRLHLHVQASLHAAHLHVLVQVAVHVALCCGQFHLKENKMHRELGKAFSKRVNL